ncbi:hypothetical protein [Streptomyces sp. NPDC002853]
MAPARPQAAREHLPHAPNTGGQPSNLFTAVLETLAEGGMDVTLA